MYESLKYYWSQMYSAMGAFIYDVCVWSRNRHFIQKKIFRMKNCRQGGRVVFKNTEKMQTSFMNAPYTTYKSRKVAGECSGKMVILLSTRFKCLARRHWLVRFTNYNSQRFGGIVSTLFENSCCHYLNGSSKVEVWAFIIWFHTEIKQFFGNFCREIANNHWWFCLCVGWFYRMMIFFMNC